MATLNGGISFTGTIGDVTAYQRKGSGKTYLKTKSGVSKEKMERDPAFELTLQNSNEFKGCSIASQRMRIAMGGVANLRSPNFNTISEGISILSPLKDMDPDGARGERCVKFSLFKHYLEGLNVNDVHLFDSIITAPFTCIINREAGTATIQIPSLEAGLNLKSPWPSPMYCLSFVFNAVEDVAFNEGKYIKHSPNKLPSGQTVLTEWTYLQERQPASEITLQLQHMENLKENMALLVSAGIQMGVPVTSKLIKEQKFQCAGKILKTG